MDRQELTDRLAEFVTSITHGAYILVDLHTSNKVRIGAPGVNKYWTVMLDEVLLNPDDLFDRLDDIYRLTAAVLGVEIP